MQPIDRLKITVVVENYVDMLLADMAPVRRAGLIHHFDPKRMPVQAEFGLSLLAEVTKDGRTLRALFDTGMSSEVLLHNMAALHVDPRDIDHVVISHGHPDHHGGLVGLLQAIERPMPVAIHPAAFPPRYIYFPGGDVASFYNHDLQELLVHSSWARLVQATGPVHIASGMVTTGAIPREVAFESPRETFLRQLDDGEMRPDYVDDDQALVVWLKDKGLVVLAGCSHAGIINTIRAAQHVTGVDEVYAVIGGFHLGFPDTPQENVDLTIEALAEFQPSIVSPMHCTGFGALRRFAQQMPDQFLLMTAGAQIDLAAGA